MGDTDYGPEEALSDKSSTNRAQDPPSSLRGVLKFLGPSFAIVAVTIGSGELIATTAAGAQVGIVALWFLVFSLIIKVGAQYEFSKYGLVEGKTPHEIFDEVPGKVFGHSWAYWWIVVNWIFTENILYMGIFFGVGTLLHYVLLQAIPISVCLLIVLVITIYPALRGYDFVEDFSTVVVLGLVVITVIAAILSFFTPYALSTDEIMYGLSFQLPDSGVSVLLAAIGLTGITAVEMIGYALYVQETGYGELAGSRSSDGWTERMSGWLRIMKIDVIVSLVLTIIVTIAFFIIGSSVLNDLGQFPNGPRLAVYLANAYEELFGPFGYWILLIGGFFALYSTIFGKTQLISSTWPDWISQTNWGEDIDNSKISTVVAIAMPIVWYAGGFSQGVITPLVLLGGSLSTLTLIPVLVTCGWALYNSKDEREEFRSTGWLRIGVIVSITGSLVMVLVIAGLSIL